MNSQTSAASSASSAKVAKVDKHPNAGLVAAMTAAPKNHPPSSPNSDADADDGQHLDSPSAIGRAVRNMLYEMDESAIFLDPPEVFDDAILGITEGDLGPVRVIYDSDHCVARMAKHHGWDLDEAMEFFSFNTLGTHVEGYPVFLAKPLDMPLQNFSSFPGSSNTTEVVATHPANPLALEQVHPIHPVNSWVVEVQNDPVTGEAILQLPEELLQAHDWREGDVLNYEIQDTGGTGPEHPAFTLINLSLNLRKQAAKEAAEQDTSLQTKFHTSNSFDSFNAIIIHPDYPGTLEKPPSGESAPPMPTIPSMRVFLVDTVVIHRHRYAIRALSQEHAFDTVVCREAEAFSKEAVDESIFSGREVSDEQFLQEPEIAEKICLIKPHMAFERFIHTVDYSDHRDDSKPAKSSES